MSKFVLRCDHQVVQYAAAFGHTRLNRHYHRYYVESHDGRYINRLADQLFVYDYPENPTVMHGVANAECLSAAIPAIFTLFAWLREHRPEILEVVIDQPWNDNYRPLPFVYSVVADTAMARTTFRRHAEFHVKRAEQADV